MEDLYDFMKRVNLFFIPVEYLILWLATKWNIAYI